MTEEERLRRNPAGVEVLQKRDDLLKETDHFGLSDHTMTDEMAAYRQALRDVPQQEGFPDFVTWPTKP